MKCHYHISFFVVILCIITLLTSLYVSQGIILRNDLRATSTRNSPYNLYLPYVHISQCKSSIFYQSIAQWNVLPVELKKIVIFQKL